MHPDDMRAQFTRAMDHVDMVSREAGAGLPNVDRFFGIDDTVTGRLAEAGCRLATTLLRVARLASLEVLVEIEAMAVL